MSGHPLSESVSEQKAVSSKDPGNPVRKTVIRLALGTLLLTLSFRAEAQQAEKVSTDRSSGCTFRVVHFVSGLEAFRQRLHELRLC